MLEDRYLTKIWLDAIFTAGDSVEVDFVLFEKSVSGVELQTCFFTLTDHLPHVASFIDSESLYSTTVEPRLSGPRLSGLFDYPDFFSGPVFFMNINKL